VPQLDNLGEFTYLSLIITACCVDTTTLQFQIEKRALLQFPADLALFRPDNDLSLSLICLFYFVLYIKCLSTKPRTRNKCTFLL
jgi:hypothetical protein